MISLTGQGSSGEFSSISTQTLTCSGDSSCSGSIIAANIENARIQVSGAKGAVDSTIYIYSNGNLSEITGSGSNKFLLLAEGYDALENAWILCPAGFNCLIDCGDSMTGCNTARLSCNLSPIAINETNIDDIRNIISLGNDANVYKDWDPDSSDNYCNFTHYESSSSTIGEGSCSNQFESQLCPGGMSMDYVEYTSIEDNPDVIYTKSNKYNSLDICISNTSSTEVYGDENDVSPSTAISKQELICCEGTKSCENQVNEIITQNETSMIFNFGGGGVSGISNSAVGIRCDGSESCYGASEITATNGGSIYFSGQGSGEGVESVIGTEISDKGIFTDVYCTGDSSCADSGKIKNVNRVFCGGSESCYKANIENARNVTFSGMWSGWEANVSFISGNVECLGRAACLSATFKDIEDFHGYGRQAAAEAIIDTVRGNLFVVGTEVLYKATVTNVANQVLLVYKCFLFAFAVSMIFAV